MIDGCDVRSLHGEARTSVTARVATSASIANTDFGWFSHFLHRAEPPDEVDFW